MACRIGSSGNDAAGRGEDDKTKAGDDHDLQPPPMPAVFDPRFLPLSLDEVYISNATSKHPTYTIWTLSQDSTTSHTTLAFFFQLVLFSLLSAHPSSPQFLPTAIDSSTYRPSIHRLCSLSFSLTHIYARISKLRHRKTLISRLGPFQLRIRAHRHQLSPQPRQWGHARRLLGCSHLPSPPTVVDNQWNATLLRGPKHRYLTRTPFPL
ncbi:hypothetical protein BDN72DRAFT_384906 [Pluteus cervinus]|uniref:Uncharacterized protein n=1 Tax=Pluteus cervinus TaxID=181527 RepID=A0ACD3AA57_9AGAR|nr:hypothetical protein BDN72DRAFT_384906 [Pluteus cervinus]